MRIELGEWLPDQPVFNNPGCVNAQNTLPKAQSYGQLNSLSSFSGALTGACLGAFWMPDTSGNAHNFAGDSTKLYKYDGSGTWDDVTSGTYSTAVSWKFEKYGDGRCIAVDIGQPVQYYDIGVTTKFQDLAGSPPQAKYVATVRDFLVLANIASNPNRVQWCGFNNSELWTPSLLTQSDFQDLPGRGANITGTVPGAYGVIFQESSIWRMDYVGPPTVWRFDEVERGRGTRSPNSIVHYGTNVFYYDPSGFYHFDGTGSTPIGHERVDQWFNTNSGDYLTIQGVIDRQNQLVLWGFKSSAAKTYNDRLVIYSFATNRWSWGEVETQYMSERQAQQITLDGLDTPFPSGIDLQSIPMDTQAFNTNLNVQAFNGSNESCTFEGAALDANFETRELSMDEHGTFTNSVRPLVDAGTVTVQFGGRGSQTVTSTYSNSVSLNRIGEASHRVNKRFQRFRFQVTGGFDYAQGVEVRSRQAGRRS